MTNSAEDSDKALKGGADATVRQTPVLVVGAGPTGLLLASELERRGVECHLIDARSGPLHWDRATVVHSRSLEIFESLGLVERFLDVGCRQRVVKVYSGGEMLGMLDLSICGSIYGFNLGLSEEVTESILTDYLHQQGGEVNRSCRLVGITPHRDGALAEIERDGDRYQVNANWVVGCGGLHSPIRELSGIGFEGHGFAKEWAVFDGTVQGWTDTYEAIVAYHDALPIILTALPGKRWRVYLRPSAEESDLVVDAASTLSRYVPAASFVDVENPTRFHCHTKVATRFRSGRLFLAGDAAHLCSPAQGHGMNCGLQDAFNLAWKLALVVQGSAHEDMLDSYEAERRPVAMMVGESGDIFEQGQMMTDPAERESRDRDIKAMLADPKARHIEAVAEAELNINYSQSPIVSGHSNDGFGPGLRVPDAIRVQWADGRDCRLHELAHRAGHTLLLLAGPNAHGPTFVNLHSKLREFAADSPVIEAAIAVGTRDDLPASIGRLELSAADLLGVEEITLFAVRPDGYIGLRSDRGHVGALEGYRSLVHAGRF